MANPEHVKILKQGVDVWNKWREENKSIKPDLSGIIYTGEKLVGVNFDGTNLRSSNFNRVDFSYSDFNMSDLSGAKLDRAKLYYVYLIEANLNLASLNGTNFRKALIRNTIFGNVNLKNTRNLEFIRHYGPSTIDFHTIKRSWPLPIGFLHGCGLSNLEIEICKLYDKNLKESEITDITYKIHDLRRGKNIFQFYSCFISYSHKDNKFAKRIHADLQDKGIRCWFAPYDMKIGDPIRSKLDKAILIHDKLLLILSSNSINSNWVEKEVETAFEKERKIKETVLFPICIDDAFKRTRKAWAADIRRTRHIGDFRDCKGPNKYKKAFERLLRDLKAEE